VLQLIESQELISRTSEFARVFGVDFFSVISRGSQYKVESLMVRLSKPENYIMISPSRAQVGAQRAAEVIPMVMEPESGFYEDPVVVLDFQSLYPSVMIAYNYCYSTCLGKLGGGTKLGVMTDYVVQDGILPLMQDHLNSTYSYLSLLSYMRWKVVVGAWLTCSRHTSFVDSRAEPCHVCEPGDSTKSFGEDVVRDSGHPCHG
jgi:hypothetical protein